jgi:hypothetical protein
MVRIDGDGVNHRTRLSVFLRELAIIRNCWALNDKSFTPAPVITSNTK